MSSNCDLEKYDLLVVDLDGVVWSGLNPITPNVEALKSLSKTRRIVYATNNSTRSRRFYASALRRLGLPATRDDVVTSGYVAVNWVKTKVGEKASILVIGEEGLIEEAYETGLKVVNVADAWEVLEDIDAVIVGLDRSLTYGKLNIAYNAILRGALFVATNLDPFVPLSGFRRALGAGGIVGALSNALGRRPDFIAGKPNPAFLGDLIKNMDPAKVVVIGDRVDTDILMANRLGVDSILVLTGATTSTEVREKKRLPAKPTCIVNTLLDLYGRH